MRRLADYYERDLIRKLRADGMTWAQVADAVQAQLSSRQAAQAKWKAARRPGAADHHRRHASGRSTGGPPTDTTSADTSATLHAGP
jgi:hypothetical protein